MYLDGLEIAGLGIGMVFLALVTILLIILGLRAILDGLEGWQQKHLPALEGAASQELEPSQAASTFTAEKSPESAPDQAARAAAIAVALYMTEEEDNTFDSQ